MGKILTVYYSHRGENYFPDGIHNEFQYVLELRSRDELMRYIVRRIEYK